MHSAGELRTCLRYMAKTTRKYHSIPHLPTRILAEYLSKRHNKGRGDLILCRHIGHNCFEVSCLIHVSRQCWEKISVLLLSLLFSTAKVERIYIPCGKNARNFRSLGGIYLSKIHYLIFRWNQSSDIQSGQSSPGNLQVGQVPSN